MTGVAVVTTALISCIITWLASYGGMAALLMQIFWVPVMMLGLECGFLSLLMASALYGICMMVVAGADEALSMLMILIPGGMIALMSGRYLSKGNTSSSYSWPKWQCYDRSTLLMPVTCAVLAILLTGISLAFRDEDGGLPGLTVKIVNDVLQYTTEPGKPLVLDARIAGFLPGMMGLCLGFVLVLNAVIADWLLVVTGLQSRRVLKFWPSSLPLWYRIGFLVVVAAGFVPHDRIRDLILGLLVIMCVPVLQTGLSALHWQIGRIGRGKTVFMLFFYGFWTIFVIPVTIIVTVIGMLAQPLGIGRPSSPHPEQ